MSVKNFERNDDDDDDDEYNDEEDDPPPPPPPPPLWFWDKTVHLISNRRLDLVRGNKK